VRRIAANIVKLPDLLRKKHLKWFSDTVAFWGMPRGEKDALGNIFSSYWFRSSGDRIGAAISPFHVQVGEVSPQEPM